MNAEEREFIEHAQKEIFDIVTHHINDKIAHTAKNKSIKRVETNVYRVLSACDREDLIDYFGWEQAEEIKLRYTNGEYRSDYYTEVLETYRFIKRWYYKKHIIIVRWSDLGDLTNRINENIHEDIEPGVKCFEISKDFSWIEVFSEINKRIREIDLDGEIDIRDNGYSHNATVILTKPKKQIVNEEYVWGSIFIVLICMVLIIAGRAMVNALEWMGWV